MFFTVWMMRSPRSADRLQSSAGLAATGVNISARYCGASPFIALNDKIPILKSIHCLIGSQCRSSRSTGTTLPRLDTPPKSRAAAFWTDCKRCMSHNGSPAISELPRLHDTNEWGWSFNSQHRKQEYQRKKSVPNSKHGKINSVPDESIKQLSPCQFNSSKKKTPQPKG